MNYTTYSYLLLFLGGTFLLYTLVPQKQKWITLLAASLFFYVVSSGPLIVFLLGTTLSIYLSALWLDKLAAVQSLVKKGAPKEDRDTLKRHILWQKRAVLLLLLLFNFGLLLFMKYFGFFCHNVNWLFAFVGLDFELPLVKMVLPLGISFYTLQAVGYVVDVYRGKFPAERNFARITLFLSFFPQIVEGPIGRYDELAPQLYEGHTFDYERFTGSLQLILWGLFKKVVIADRANALVSAVFDHYEQYAGLLIALAVLAYTLQLYAEFSGCMDIVTGSARLFGVGLSPNFRRPFFSRSVTEFWRRWHITLGAWLRDYVFYPLSLSKPFGRLSKAARKHLSKHLAASLPAIAALFFVWFANGVWHGAAWKYIAYGLYYYVIIALGMLCEPLFAKGIGLLHLRRESAGYRLFQMLRTFLLVNLGMLLFRAKSLSAAVAMFGSLFSSAGPSLIQNGVLNTPGIRLADFYVLLAGAAILLIVGILQERGIGVRALIARQPLVIRWAVYLAAVFVVVIFGAYGMGYQRVAFIYAGF